MKGCWLGYQKKLAEAADAVKKSAEAAETAKELAAVATAAAETVKELAAIATRKVTTLLRSLVLGIMVKKTVHHVQEKEAC